MHIEQNSQVEEKMKPPSENMKKEQMEVFGSIQTVLNYCFN